MKNCKLCHQDLLESEFPHNRRMCKKCYRTKYTNVICKDCGTEYPKSSSVCVKCKHDNLLKNGKECNCCKITKPIEDFGKITKGKKLVRSYCKQCEVLRGKEYRINNPEKVKTRKKSWSNKNPESVKKTQIRTNLRRWNYDQDLEVKTEQIFNCTNCESCGRQFSETNNKHMDHCHETNKFRGTICRSCNHLLGQAGDSVEILEKAIKYLQRD